MKKGREGKGREGKGREGRGGKGREGKGQDRTGQDRTVEKWVLYVRISSARTSAIPATVQVPFSASLSLKCLVKILKEKVSFF